MFVTDRVSDLASKKARSIFRNKSTDQKIEKSPIVCISTSHKSLVYEN